MPIYITLNPDWPEDTREAAKFWRERGADVRFRIATGDRENPYIYPDPRDHICFSPEGCPHYRPQEARRERRR